MRHFYDTAGPTRVCVCVCVYNILSPFPSRPRARCSFYNVCIYVQLCKWACERNIYAGKRQREEGSQTGRRRGVDHLVIVCTSSAGGRVIVRDKPSSPPVDYLGAAFRCWRHSTPLTLRTSVIFTDRFSGPRRAIGPMCVSVCVFRQHRLN